MFDAPVPGQSLTAQPGGLPMERPPQFTDPNEALEFLFQKLTMPKKVTQLVVLLKKDIPVEYIVRTALFEGVVQGKWTPDVALLMAQTATWMVESIAKLKGVKTTLKNKDEKHQEFLENFVDLLDKPSPKSAPISKTLFTGL